MDAISENSIDGTWQLVRAELDGEIAHELLTTNTVLELKSGTYTVRYAGEVTDRGSFELPDQASSTLVMHGSNGPNAGRTIPCLYRRAGDRLRVCFGLDGVAPTTFSSSAEQHRYLAIYRRLND